MSILSLQITMDLISGMVISIPIEDCSGLIQEQSDLTEDEIQLCSASAQFEDFVLQYIDRYRKDHYAKILSSNLQLFCIFLSLHRILTLIENISQEHTRGNDVSATHAFNKEEGLLAKNISDSIHSIFGQCSLPIFEVKTSFDTPHGGESMATYEFGSS